MPKNTKISLPQTSQEDNIALRVWDAPTRLFHWLLSILIGVSWLSGEVGIMAVHMVSGLIILTLLIFRLVWGIIGSTTARFSYFVRGPRVVLAYLANLFRAPVEPLAGHNPAGGLAIVLMLASLAVQVGSGLFANDDILTEGPLAYLISKIMSDRLTILHKVTFNILLGLISLHLLANLFYLLIKGENLVRPMITGYRLWPIGRAEPQLYFALPTMAFLVLILSILVVLVLL